VAVVNDLELLATLPARDLRSGIAEAVKVSLIRDREFFEQLWRGRTRLAAFESGAMEAMIIRCAEIHLAHVRSCGDPFELGSARPLDFGHWSAHKLEELSRGELRHGEAVAMGIAIDALYSHHLGMIGEEDLHRILSLLADLGFDLHHPLLGRLDIETALADFREHLGGELCITLLEGIGRGVEVREIDLEIMRKCVGLLHRGT
jgi:3-dehydroquinate synthase